MSYENNNNSEIPSIDDYEKKGLGKTKKKPVNTSGTGERAVVPSVVKNRFNWGAFLLTWIWGIGNKTYITFVVLGLGILNVVLKAMTGTGNQPNPLSALFALLILVVSLGLQIWFGIKGNEWAWRNKRFKNIEHFHSYQRKWAIAGVIVSVLSVILVLALIFVVSALVVAAMNGNIR